MANHIWVEVQTIHRIWFAVWTLRASFRSVKSVMVCDVLPGCADAGGQRVRSRPAHALRTVGEAFKTERGNLSKMQHHPFNVERSDRSGMHGREGSGSGCGAPVLPWGESFIVERFTVQS